MSDITRKLASVQRIAEIKPIEGADRICAYRVGGWDVVDQKDKYTVGDLVVYFEIDTFISQNLAPFLIRNNKPKVYNGVKGERLKTIRLKGQVSQGLILPLHILDEWDSGEMITITAEHYYREGDDVTDVLGVQKWEPVMPAQLRGVARGNFPVQFPRTDQERVQNLTKYLGDYSKMRWTVEEKLDGSSMTVYMVDGRFGVCSRNLDLTESEENTFWKVANRYNLREKFESLDMGSACFAVQGELIGPGIQGNPYGLTQPDIRVFDIHDGNSYISAQRRSEIVNSLGLTAVPVLHTEFDQLSSNVDDILEMAQGTSQLCDVEREGIVFKSLDDPNVSFKAISNKFLLKGK